MSEKKWTTQQLQAISGKDCSLLVSAAAGAGKTAVLVERIVKKVTDGANPVDIDRLLVVTFTNAAATEMRERIGDAIAQQLEVSPEPARLQRQLMLLNRASITTIHSFCLEVIKNNFHYIDIDPAFRIAEETEAELLKEEAIDQLFDEMYEEQDANENFMALIESYGSGRDDRKVQEMVLELYDFVRSHPWPEKWLDEFSEEFNRDAGTDFGETKWGQVLKSDLRMEFEGFQYSLKQAYDAASEDPALSPYAGNIEGDMIIIEKIRQSLDSCWDDLKEYFSNIEFTRLARCGKDADKDKQDFIKNIRNEVKDRVNELKESLFSATSSDIYEEHRKLYPMIKCLSELVIKLDEKYTSKKRDKGLLDFSDLEHLCLKILTDTTQNEENGRNEIKPSKAAVELRERFHEILIDEYQDSNLIQDVILSAISRDAYGTPNIFMVGDVKQSIYRFRQAKPELFLEKYNSYSDNSEDIRRKILLHRNFRSRKGVIDAINYIFKQIMSKNIGEIEYGQKEALYPGALYPPKDDQNAAASEPVELLLADMADSELSDMEAVSDTFEQAISSETEEEPPDSAKCEARIAVKKIRQLTGANGSKPFEICDKEMGKYRKVEYKDIVILMRATKSMSQVFVEEMTLQGIPVYADTNTGFFKTTEVQTVLSLLQIIDNPRQDIPLLAVLRSPMAGFSAEELIDIRIVNREVSLYEALCMAAETEGNLGERLNTFLNKLRSWRRKAQYTPTNELIWYLYGETGYYSYAGTMPGGIQRQANLRILFERARQYENTSYKGLFNFIGFIEKIKNSSGDMGSAKILGENENVVRIMSIHKSKGLEFPVVILAGCGRMFNFRDAAKSILFHQDLGFGPDFVDYKRRLSYPSMAKQAIKYKMKVETLSEEMRILYVALTRAREKLVITASLKNVSKSIQKWCRHMESEDMKLPVFESIKARCYLDWIVPALARHSGLKGFFEGYLMQTPQCKWINDESVWDAKVWRRNELLESVAILDEFKVKPFPQALTSDSKMKTEIERRLDWVYPYPKSGKIPAKISVTEIKRLFNADSSDILPSQVFLPPYIKKPAFLEETRSFSAAEKGSITHFIMQHLDLKRISVVLNETSSSNQLNSSLEAEIGKQLEEMIAKSLISVQQAAVTDNYRIRRFLTSDMGKRMLKSGLVYREVPFNTEISAAEIFKDLSAANYSSEKILLQGAIDCYFEEDNEIILLDYKTDFIPDENHDFIKEKYRLQIEYYAKALSMLTGKTVREKYIYLFWNGEVIAY